MNSEDEEFNRIEREASLRKAAVREAVSKKDWIGFTDEEVMQLAFNFDVPSLVIRTAEALLQDKNT
jgi:hypothetical protein